MHIILLVAIQLTVIFQHLGKANNRIHRGAQFMAHTRKEIRFSAISALSRFARRNQLLFGHHLLSNVLHRPHHANHLS